MTLNISCWESEAITSTLNIEAINFVTHTEGIDQEYSDCSASDERVRNESVSQSRVYLQPAKAVSA